jgi:hypothetical protein
MSMEWAPTPPHKDPFIVTALALVIAAVIAVFKGWL